MMMLFKQIYIVKTLNPVNSGSKSSKGERERERERERVNRTLDSRIEY